MYLRVYTGKVNTKTERRKKGTKGGTERKRKVGVTVRTEMRSLTCSRIMYNKVYKVDLSIYFSVCVCTHICVCVNSCSKTSS